MKAYQKIGAVLTLVLGCSATANAAVLYNNLSADAGVVTDGLSFFANGYIANEFSTSTLCPSGCALGDITLNLVSTGPSTSGYSLAVFANVAGAPGGAALITMNNPSSFSMSPSNILFTPSGTYNLAANTNYWVELIGNNPSETLSWDYYTSAVQTVPNQPNQGVFSLGGFPGTRSGLLMKVEATPNLVPVPGAIWMMGAAVIGLMASWRQKPL